MEKKTSNQNSAPSSRPANRSMPSSIVIPVLHYSDVREAVRWLSHAFGFVERLRIGNHRSQLSFGDGAIVVTQLPDGADAGKTGKSGALQAATTHSIMVRVQDANRHFERAKASGAQIVTPPQDYPYGERQYSAMDIGGHLWTFSETIADVDPGAWGGALLT